MLNSEAYFSFFYGRPSNWLICAADKILSAFFLANALPSQFAFLLSKDNELSTCQVLEIRWNRRTATTKTGLVANCVGNVNSLTFSLFYTHFGIIINPSTYHAQYETASMKSLNFLEIAAICHSDCLFVKAFTQYSPILSSVKNSTATATSMKRE